MSTSLSKNCFCTSGPEHLSGTTTGMSTSLSKKSGPEHLCGTTTGMSTSLSKKSGPEHLCGTTTGMSTPCRGTATAAPPLLCASGPGHCRCTHGHDNLVQELHLWERHESAQFALCVPVVLGARTAGACRCMTQRRQPPSTVSSTMGTCRCTKRASQQPCPRTAPALSRAPWARVVAQHGHGQPCPRTAPALSRAPEAPVVAHNGHVNDVEEKREKFLVVHTGHDAEHLGREDKQGTQREINVTSKTSNKNVHLGPGSRLNEASVENNIFLNCTCGISTAETKKPP